MTGTGRDLLAEVASLEERERMCVAQAAHAEHEERWALMAFWLQQAEGFNDQVAALREVRATFEEATIDGRLA